MAFPQKIYIQSLGVFDEELEVSHQLSAVHIGIVGQYLFPVLLDYSVGELFVVCGGLQRLLLVLNEDGFGSLLVALDDLV